MIFDYMMPDVNVLIARTDSFQSAGAAVGGVRSRAVFATASSSKWYIGYLTPKFQNSDWKQDRHEVKHTEAQRKTFAEALALLMRAQGVEDLNSIPSGERLPPYWLIRMSLHRWRKP